MTRYSSLIDQNSQSQWQQLLEVADDIDEAHYCLVKRVMGLSDFIAQQLLSHPQWLMPLNARLISPEQTLDYCQALNEQLGTVETEAELTKTLRQFRHQHMVQIAALDLLNLQSISRSLKETSELADALINAAYHWLYTHFCTKYATPQGEHGPQPMLILGMGKLGGHELNFSSDIDLIFCYPSNGELSGTRKSMEHQQFFTKLAQRLIHALDSHDQFGRVFRVDMRLRPMGESGPLVMHMSAFEDYYQEQGREWERYAMVKARILNDNSTYADELQAILRPFVYRRYIDFSAMDSLREMKSLINQEVRRRGLKNNIKLGAGGIREVEFIAQSFQLIKGGKQPELQTTSLLNTLTVLSASDLLDSNDESQLREAYLFLRKVEHSLQQFHDQQTQLLPDKALDRARLCAVMNVEDYETFLHKLDLTMAKIHHQFDLLIGEQDHQATSPVSEKNQTLKDIWQLSLTNVEIQTLLCTYVDEELAISLAEQIHDFKAQTAKKHPSARAIDTLQKLVPQILEQVILRIGESAAPGEDVALFKRVAFVIVCILRRTTYLQLLLENQGAQHQLVKLCHASPWIAEQIARFPMLLDELLNPAQLYRDTPFDAFSAELRQMLLRVEPDDLELQMETLRQFKQIQLLRIASKDVSGIIPVMKVSDNLTFLAQAIIEEVINMAWQQMREKYGVPDDTSDEDKKFAVLGYGKLGGIELGYGSDLDLVFVHNANVNGRTNGIKQLETTQFYIKLAQRIMHLFMTNTSTGQLYEVDMRLRPSGNSGLLVCHVKAFEQYQLQEAWIWEHQALVRARVVYGNQNLAEQVNQIRKSVLCLPRDTQKLNTEVAGMREKMRTHLNKGDRQWLDVKQDEGGIADIEFLVQYWVLAHSIQTPELTKWSDNVRILEQLAAFRYIDQSTKSILTEAYLDYRNQSHRLTLLEKANLVEKQLFIEHLTKVKAIWQHTFGNLQE